MHITNYKIILASNSPRRKELLSGLDIGYEIRTLPDIDEEYPNDIPLEKVAEFLARKKTAAYLPVLNDNELLITADTIVFLNNKIYGKPVNNVDAEQMLRDLSTNTFIITGVCLTSTKKQVVFSDTTKVTFFRFIGRRD